MMSKLRSMIQEFELNEAEVPPASTVVKVGGKLRRGLGSKGDAAIAQAADKFKDLSGGKPAGEVAKDAGKPASREIPALGKPQPEIAADVGRAAGAAGKSVGSSGALARVQAKLGGAEGGAKAPTGTGVTPQAKAASGEYIPKSTPALPGGGSGGAGGDIPGSWKNIGAEPTGGLGKFAKGAAGAAGAAGLAGLMSKDSSQQPDSKTYDQNKTAEKPADKSVPVGQAKSTAKATGGKAPAKPSAAKKAPGLSKQEEMELNMLSVDMEKAAASNPEVKAALDKYYSIYGK